MSIDLQIQLTGAEGALLRALGVLQRRGWEVRQLLAHHEGEQGLSVALCVAAERGRRETLMRQLARLPEVVAVGSPCEQGVQWVRASAGVG